MYGSAVQRLSALLICCPPHVRPNAAERLAPFDQASQKPMFGSGTDRGSPEEFLRWATNRMHPAASPPPALPQDLEAAIVYVWRLGDNIADDREQRMCVVRAVSCDLEPLSRAICVMMSPAAVRIARAMQLNIMRRERPKAQLADIGDQLYSTVCITACGAPCLMPSSGCIVHSRGTLCMDFGLSVSYLIPVCGG